MKLVVLRKSHIDEIIHFEKEYAPDKPVYSRSARESLAYIFDSPHTCGAFGVFEDSALVAWGAYRSKEGIGEVSSIVVSSQFQGKGIGKQILNRLLDELHKLPGLKEIFLTVHPDNTRALKLYKQAGFIVSEEKKDMYGPGMDRLILKLNRIF